jgi:hypothetical protein
MYYLGTTFNQKYNERFIINNKLEFWSILFYCVQITFYYYNIFFFYLCYYI